MEYTFDFTSVYETISDMRKPNTSLSSITQLQSQLQDLSKEVNNLLRIHKFPDYVKFVAKTIAVTKKQIPLLEKWILQHFTVDDLVLLSYERGTRHGYHYSVSTTGYLASKQIYYTYTDAYDGTIEWTDTARIDEDEEAPDIIDDLDDVDIEQSKVNLCKLYVQSYSDANEFDDLFTSELEVSDE